MLPSTFVSYDMSVLVVCATITCDELEMDQVCIQLFLGLFSSYWFSMFIVVVVLSKTVVVFIEVRITVMLILTYSARMHRKS